MVETRSNGRTRRNGMTSVEAGNALEVLGSVVGEHLGGCTPSGEDIDVLQKIIHLMANDVASLADLVIGIVQWISPVGGRSLAWTAHGRTP